jgi:two-component system, sensor histidine kinase LadS
MLRLWFLVCWIISLHASLAVAGTDAPVPSLVQKPWSLAISQNVSTQVTVEQVAQRTAGSLLALKPFQPELTHPLGVERAVWLELEIAAGTTPAPDGYVVRVPKPFIDRVEFYALDAQGGWRMQAAGDKVTHSQWPLSSLDPQFMLPVLTPGTHRFYLRVQNDTPLQFNVLVQRGNQNNADNHFAFLQGGIMLGWMAFIALLSLLLAWLYRQSIYAWYALFVAFTFLSVASHLGLASYWFWPDTALWPSYSVVVLMVLTVMAQLQFCRLFFLNDHPKHWLHAITWGTQLLSAVLLVGLWATDSMMVLLALYELALAVCVSTMACIVFSGLRHGHWAAKYWVVAYLPVLVVVVLQIIENIGLAAFDGMFFYAPLYAVIFETMVLMVVLHFHVKNQLTRTVRQSTLAATDPQTGFVNSQIFPNTFEALWDDAQTLGQDLAVAYIEVSYSLNHISARGKPAKLRSQQRVVRLLRTVAHERDVVAHVDRDLFALVMPGVSMGEQLSDTLSRLVALGAMTDKDAAHDVPIRFHIATSAASVFEGSADQVHKALQRKLNQTDWGRKAIRYVRKRSAQSVSSSTPSDESLSAFWRRAVAAQAKSDSA